MAEPQRGEIAKLRARVQELERERHSLARLIDKTELRFRRKVDFLVAKAAVRVLVGPGLLLTFKRWLEAAKRDRLPVDESAALGAAIVRRVIHVGLVTAMLGALPVLAVFWQTLEVRWQTQEARRQAGIQQTQLEQQRASDEAVQRAQQGSSTSREHPMRLFNVRN